MLMSKKSVKANAFFNTFKEFLDLAVPLITFPYVTRVLLPDNLGKVQFATSIVAMFAYFASLGIPLYGVRKIAAIKDDIKERSKVFFSILVLESVLTFLVYVAFFISIFTVSKFNKEIILYLILGLRIGLKIFGFEWFFKGMEEYRFMAMRKFVAKIIGVILIFWLIKGPEDYILYGLISILTDFFSKVMNFLNLKRMVKKVSRHEIDLKEHISGSIYFFMIFISAKIYADIDKVMLGFISTNASVSYYVTANKLINIIRTMFNAATAVLIPRFSYLFAQGKSHKFKPLARKAFSIIFFLPLPAMAGLYLLTEEVVLMFGGHEYLPAVLTMRILLPVLFLLPIKSFVGTQILLTHGQHKTVIISVSLATVFNVIINAFLIPRFSQNGAAVATLLSEAVIISLEMLVAYKYIKKLDLNIIRNFIYIIATLFMSACVFFTKKYLTAGLAPMSQLLASSLIGAVTYFLFLTLFRENLFLPMIIKMIAGKKRGGKKDLDD